MTSPETTGDVVEPAPPLTLREPLPAVAETEAALAEVVARVAAGTGPVALDAERASGYRYSQRAYLVQLRRAGSGTALIDPAPFGDVPNDMLAGLAEAIAGDEWIIHAASQDLACLAELGMRPARLFDTELAGRLLNFPRVGLAVLVEELLGYRLRKEHSAADWSRRPLPTPWLEYAALDVEMLVELRDVLADRLAAAGKEEWARQEFAATAATTYGQPRTDPWRRTSGIHRVRGRRGLALVRALWECRDELARHRDISAGRVLPDAAIVEAASTAPKSRNELAELPTYRSRAAQRHLREFWAAISQASRLPDSQLPPVSGSSDGPPAARMWAARFPEAAARLAACRGAVAVVAAEVDLPAENLVPPDAVRRLAWDPPERFAPDAIAAALSAPGARPWQVELTAGPLAAALTAAVGED